MLVSTRISPELRADVAAGRRPCPEFLKLEATHDFRLLDWSAAGIPPRAGRGAATFLRHLRSALRPVADADTVLTDGEHLGLPLAMAIRALRVRTPHVMIGHHLTTRGKRPWFRLLHAERAIDRIVVHSDRQAQLAGHRLGLSSEKVEMVPYGVDTDFWRPTGDQPHSLIAAAGREHRDYLTLARACESLPLRVFVADASLHNPGARRRAPVAWPANVEYGSLDPARLRELYGSAQIVVVPLVAADFPAGITSILEAMAMAKPVIVSATAGLAGIIEDGRTGLLVPPGDVGSLKAAIRRLVADPAERRRLGSHARDAVVARYGVSLYASRLADLVSAAAGG